VATDTCHYANPFQSNQLSHSITNQIPTVEKKTWRILFDDGDKHKLTYTFTFALHTYSLAHS
jgi:hypothetical protein